MDSFSEHLFRSAWGSDGDEDEQAENKPSGGCWLQKRRRADVWAIHLSWIFFFFSFFLISRIFYCFFHLFVITQHSITFILGRIPRGRVSSFVNLGYGEGGTFLPVPRVRRPETLPLAPHPHLPTTPDLLHLAQLAEDSFWDFGSQTVMQRQRK